MRRFFAGAFATLTPVPAAVAGAAATVDATIAGRGGAAAIIAAEEDVAVAVLSVDTSLCSRRGVMRFFLSTLAVAVAPAVPLAEVLTQVLGVDAGGDEWP